MTEEEIAQLEDRIRLAYATALHQRHLTTGVVEIHMAQNVADYLNEKFEWMPAPYRPPTVWGFPLVLRGPDNYIAVHTVEVIL